MSELSSLGAVSLSVEHEVLAAFSEAFRDDLRVEGIRKDLGPFFERAIRGDRRGSTVVVAFADDLEREIGLGPVHGKRREVVDDEKLCFGVFAEYSVEVSVKLGAMQFVEHLWGWDEDDSFGGLACPVRQGPR